MLMLKLPPVLDCKELKDGFGLDVNMESSEDIP